MKYIFKKLALTIKIIVILVWGNNIYVIILAVIAKVLNVASTIYFSTAAILLVVQRFFSFDSIIIAMIMIHFTVRCKYAFER